MQDTPDLLQRLLDAGVDFVIVGGVAAAIHGSARNTDESIGRPRDQETALELRAIRDRLRGRPHSAS